MGKNLKTLLILSGGAEAIKGIISAKEMGLRVIVADGNPEAPGRRYSDVFIPVNIYDSEATLKAIKSYEQQDEISGVITIAADNPKSVSRVADYLDLPGPSLTTAKLATNKLDMKNIFKKNNLPIPWYSSVESQLELQEILTKRPAEYVLKPVDSRGSRGVIRLSDIKNVPYAWEFSLQNSPSKTLILEEWLVGDQLSTESIVWNGMTYLCGLADRNYKKLDELYPFVVEDGGETPSKYSPLINQEVNDLMTKAAIALGLESGSIKGDIVNTSSGLQIIEVATRLSGGFFSTDTIPMVYGYSLIEQVIRMALGEEPLLPNAPLTNNFFQANRFLFLPPGKIKAIRKRAQNCDDIILDELYVKEGEVIARTDNHTKRSGTVMSVSATREQAIANCIRIIEGYDIEMSSD